MRADGKFMWYGEGGRKSEVNTDSSSSPRCSRMLAVTKENGKNKGVILVIDRLISKQTKRGSSKGEKGQEDERSRSSFF